MHTVTHDAHCDLAILTYTGDLEAAELPIDDELRLNAGHKVYILVDVSGMNNGLPDGFLETIQRSFVIHPNIGHIAVYITSSVLRIAAGMVIKVARLQNKATIHSSYEASYDHLVRLMRLERMKTDSRAS